MNEFIPIRGVREYFSTLQFRHLHNKFSKTLQIVTKTSRISAEILVLSLPMLPFFPNTGFSTDQFYWQLEVWQSTLACLIKW